jgi:hypothetical protein
MPVCVFYSIYVVESYGDAAHEATTWHPQTTICDASRVDRAGNTGLPAASGVRWMDGRCVGGYAINVPVLENVGAER